MIKIINKNLYTYGVNKNSNFQIIKVSQKINYSKFDLRITLPGTKVKFIRNIIIPIIGFHNIRNATAAVAVASSIGVSNKLIKVGLKEFKGVQRRFTYLFSFQGVPFFDDYAHHPSEIIEVLNGVREVYKNKEIVCVFQPHRISRVKSLKREFSSAFKKADTVVLCPIYKAGENIRLGFNYLNFAKEIIKNSNVKLIIIKNNLDLIKYSKKNIYGDKIVIGMGAGSISGWIRELKNFL